VLANGIAIFALAGLLFFFSQYLQLVRGLSPLIAGLVELPATIMSVLVALVAVAIVKRLGAGRSIATGLTLGGGGLALVGFAAGQEGIHWILIGVSVAGLGIGLAMTLSTDAIVSAAPVERAGAASAISETAYELGVAMGIALLGSLQTVFYRWLLQTPSGLDDAIAAQVRESLPIGLKALDETVAIQAEAAHLAREAFTSGVQTTAVVAAVLLIVAALTAWKLIPSQRPQEAPSKTT
jgi:MFS transporter